MQKGKMVVLGGLTNSYEKKRSERQRRKRKIYLFESSEYIMRNIGLDEAQTGIKIARRNFNNLRYAGDTTLMAEREEELKSLFMKVKEESGKVGLKKSWLKASTFRKQRSLHLVLSLHGK